MTKKGLALKLIQGYNRRLSAFIKRSEKRQKALNREIKRLKKKRAS